MVVSGLLTSRAENFSSELLWSPQAAQQRETSARLLRSLQDCLNRCTWRERHQETDSMCSPGQFSLDLLACAILHQGIKDLNVSSPFSLILCYQKVSLNNLLKKTAILFDELEFSWFIDRLFLRVWHWRCDYETSTTVSSLFSSCLSTFNEYIVWSRVWRWRGASHAKRISSF